MKYCTNCGKELRDGAVQCLHCGYIGYRDAPVQGVSPTGADEKRFRTNEKSFNYSVIFYIIIILDILICIFIGWGFFDIAVAGQQDLKSLAIIWGIILLINLILDTVLLNNIRNSPHTIDMNVCWTKCMFGFLGIFTALSGLYFLIISLIMMRQVSPQKENSSEYWYNKGVEFSESHQYENALQAYNKALSIDNRDPDIWNNICYVLIKLGRYEDAIHSGVAGANLAPNDPEIWETLRNAYLANHNPEKAAECENKISGLRAGSAGKPLTVSDKTIGICCGLLIFFFFAIAIISNWRSLGNNLSNLIYWIIFLIILAGILYEGWKAVKP